MAKTKMDLKLTVSFMKQGNRHVAYSPALDFSTAGKSKGDAKKKFEEAVMLFLEELIESGNAEKVLSDLGWQKGRNALPWMPPATSQEEVRVPISVN